MSYLLLGFGLGLLVAHNKDLPFIVVLRYLGYIIDQIHYIFHRRSINMMAYLFAICPIVVNLQVTLLLFQAMSSALSCLGLFTRRETGRAAMSSVG